jgi:hypothetical protein
VVLAREAGGRRTGIVDAESVMAAAKAMNDRHAPPSRPVLGASIHPRERVDSIGPPEMSDRKRKAWAGA